MLLLPDVASVAAAPASATAAGTVEPNTSVAASAGGMAAIPSLPLNLKPQEGQ